MFYDRSFDAVKVDGQMIFIGDPDPGSEKAGDYILPGVEVEFEEGLLHGDAAFPAGGLIAVGTCDDGVLHFQLGKKAYFL